MALSQTDGARGHTLSSSSGGQPSLFSYPLWKRSRLPAIFDISNKPLTRSSAANRHWRRPWWPQRMDSISRCSSVSPSTPGSRFFSAENLLIFGRPEGLLFMCA